MSVILFVVGMFFLLSGVLSLAGITKLGMTYASMTQFHTLPILNTYPETWPYIGLGLLLVVVGFMLAARRKKTVA